MRKVSTRLAGMVIALAMAGSVLATDVWRAKDYKQWDAKDVDKILNDSPWVKETTVGKFWTTPPAPAANGAAAKPDEGGPPAPGSVGATSSYTVRWTSAVTMRHAIARNAELSHQGDTADAEAYANAVSDTYDIALIGDMTPFGVLDTTDAIQKVQQATYLESKDSADHMMPVKVELGRAADGKTVQAITFHFAKKNAAGAPVFPADAKGVDFVCKYGKFDLKAHFDFTKMTGQNGSDF
ncbi:MAG: hypothetical protein WBE97_05185 [Candidatus Acidiferrales bacterium]